MAFVVFTRRNIAALKLSFTEAFPKIGSSHADEALAAGIGFRSHAALLAALKARANARARVVLNDRLLAQRLYELTGQHIAAERLSFWLLRWAVETLPENSGSTRRAVYEDARAALAERLRTTTPPLPARDITADRLQLEDFIRQLEHEASEAAVTTSWDRTAIQWQFADGVKHAANQN
jgi:hypothetical protein